MTVVGLVVRAHYLSVPMRGDESNTYFGYVSKSWWTAISAYPVPNNHVLNSFLAKIAITVFGVNAWSLRFPAFLAGVAIVPAAYWCARAQFPTNAALVATALVTASAPLVTATAAVVSAIIKAIRRRLNVSQERLAHQAGVDRTYVAKVERAIVNPTIYRISRVLRAAGVSWREFGEALDAELAADSGDTRTAR